MNKFTYSFFGISILCIFTACGGGGGSDSGSDSSNSDDENVTEETTILQVSNLSTGTIAEPTFVYYDLDNNEVVDISESEASENADWDIAFNRTRVFLNSLAATPVSLYFLNNTDEFYDETTGEAIVDRFVNATADTELAAFEALSPTIPDDSEFNTDETVAAIDGWYTYDVATHTVSAATDMYFIVDSDGAYTKFNVSELVQDGFGLSSLTFTTAYQTVDEEVFGEEQSLIINASDCGADAIYLDFDTSAIVTDSDDWDLSVACADALIDFDMNIADDARAINDQDEADAVGLAEASIDFLSWVPNTDTIRAYVEYGDSRSTYGWGEYGLNGGFLLWQNFAAYIIKTEMAYYKFQITSYYDTSTLESGSYSFRYELITE